MSLRVLPSYNKHTNHKPSRRYWFLPRESHKKILFFFFFCLPSIFIAIEKEKEIIFIVRKRTMVRNRYNQAPHLTQDTNWKVTTSQLDITNESQEFSAFPAGDHKASINRPFFFPLFIRVLSN